MDCATIACAFRPCVVTVPFVLTSTSPPLPLAPFEPPKFSENP